MNKIQNENWVNALPDEAVKVAEEINVEIAKVIAERIKTIGELSPADAKKLNNSIQYLGADFSKITKLIAKHSKQGQMAVVDMLQKAADGNDEFAKTFYSAKGLLAVKWREDPYLHSLVEGMARQTIAEFTNLSQTLAYKIDDKTLTLRQMYTRAIDKAIYEVHSGTVDYHTAMRKTVKQLANNMKVVKWDSGYVRRLDSHVRQNLLDGVKQLQSQMLDYHGEKYGSDGVEISAHAISAPDHAPVQGRQFSNENFARMQSGLSFEDVMGNEYDGFPRPISQWNCRHIKFRIIIGVSQPAYTDEQLRTFAENSWKKYGLTQQQRAMETKLRKLKNERLVCSAAGDEIEAKRTQRKINELQAKYRKFSENNDLLYNTKRASVEGYRRISAKISTHFIQGDIINNKSPDGSPALSKQFTQELVMQYDKFERTFGELTEIKEVKTMRYENNNIWGTYNDNSGCLTLFGHGGKNGFEFISKLSKQMKSEGIWSSGSPFHIFRHELAHSWLKSQKTNGSFTFKLQKVETLKNAVHATLTNDSKNDKITMKNLLSTYGLRQSTDIDDFICESIAEYLNGKPRSLSKQVVKILLEE